MQHVSLPLTGITFREVGEHDLEITLPGCDPSPMTTTGLSAVDGLRTSHVRRQNTITIVDGETGFSNGVPCISVRKSSSSKEMSITICSVGKNHWVAEISCKAPYTVSVQNGEGSWSHTVG